VQATLTLVFVCVCVECVTSTEAEEGWETVQRTNKTKSRPSPTAATPPRAVVPARQADGDNRRMASQLRHKEGNSRTNATVSRQNRSTAPDVRKQQCSVSAINVSGNTSVCKKTQQSKSSSHVGGGGGSSRAERASKSSQTVTPVNSVPSDVVKSDVCLDAAECRAAETECAESLTDVTAVSGNASTEHTQQFTVMQPDISTSRDMTAMHQPSLNSRASSSMTEVSHSESTDIQRSSSDSDRQSFHLCRKSVSDDTLVLERMTVSGLCYSCWLD